jgi:hypothetical protein
MVNILPSSLQYWQIYGSSENLGPKAANSEYYTKGCRLFGYFIHWERVLHC